MHPSVLCTMVCVTQYAGSYAQRTHSAHMAHTDTAHRGHTDNTQRATQENSAKRERDATIVRDLAARRTKNADFEVKRTIIAPGSGRRRARASIENPRRGKNPPHVLVYPDGVFQKKSQRNPEKTPYRLVSSPPRVYRWCCRKRLKEAPCEGNTESTTRRFVVSVTRSLSAPVTERADEEGLRHIEGSYEGLA
jgi:hypothetical protein